MLVRSWQLLSRSLRVIFTHRKLLLLPLISSGCAVVMMLFFLSPAALYPTGHAITTGDHWQELLRVLGVEALFEDEPRIDLTIVFYVYGIVIYLVSMFTATFFNVAYYSEIMKALSGQPVSVHAGLRFACRRLPAILTWSLFAGVVGLVIKSLEERFGLVGRWVMRFVGVVWSVASIFAIPVIIRDGNPNPVVLLRNSALTLRKTWGESLIGYVGITFGSWIVLAGVLGVIASSFVLGGLLGQPLIPVLSMIGTLLALVVMSILVALAGTVYRCALYIYASEGVIPEPYDAALMEGAWKVKKA
jgi:hypothetical protein